MKNRVEKNIVGDKEGLQTIHLIGHAHIDPVWLWRWREGFSEVRSTFRSVLKLMKIYPDFRFTAGSTCFYEWVQQVEPELFEEIIQRVNEGRWEYVGCFYVEPDCNLPSGESFVRHGLYSQLYYERVFGKRARVGFAPDSFGHAGSLPEIFKKLGIESYVFMRPSPPLEKKYEEGTTFVWEAPSGTSIIASVIPENYGGNASEVIMKIKKIKEYPFWVCGQRDYLCFFGVGNHGGGPTAETIDSILRTKEEAKDISIKFSRLEDFFESIISSGIQLPVIRGSLHHHARGCYSVYSKIKKLNRETEHLLITAEKFVTLGWTLGLMSYPQMELENAWKSLLFCQFHDILGGTCIKSAYDDVLDFLGYSRCVAWRFINDFIQRMAKEIRTENYGFPVILFNPLPWDVSEVVFISEFVSKDISGEVEFIDDEGRVIPSQTVVGDRPEGVNFAMLVNVPSMGYRVFYVRGKDTTKSKKSYESGRQLKWDSVNKVLENYCWRLLFDSEDGGVKCIFDKENEIEIVKGSFKPIPILDTSDTWSHGVNEFRNEAGSFELIDDYLLDIGEVLANYVQVFEFNSSKVIQKVSLYRDLPYIDLQLDIVWNEKYITLKWGLESTINNGIATYEIPYCVEERKTTGEEEPGHHWIDLSGEINGITYGISIITDSNYGYDVKENNMRITLLRSPAYAHHDPARLEFPNVYPIIDQGTHSMRLRILPHKGSWKDANTHLIAFQFNVPVIAQVEANHKGKRNSHERFIEIDKQNVVISALKKSEQGNNIIIRAYEAMGKETNCNFNLKFLGVNFSAYFSPFEVKTFKFIDGKVIETNLMED